LPQAPQSSTPTKADDNFNFKALSLLPKLPALQRDYFLTCGGASASVVTEQGAKLRVGTDHCVGFWTRARGRALGRDAIDDAGAVTRSGVRIVVVARESDSSHLDGARARHVATAQIADVHGALRCNAEGRKGRSEGTGVGLRYTDLFRENRYLEQRQQPDALEEPPHDPTRREAGVADESAADAVRSESLESRLRPFDRDDLVSLDLVFQGRQELLEARRGKLDAERIESAPCHCAPVEHRPAVPLDLMAAPGVAQSRLDHRGITSGEAGNDLRAGRGAGA
jgi:hypothetical protein